MQKFVKKNIDSKCCTKILCYTKFCKFLSGDHMLWKCTHYFWEHCQYPWLLSFLFSKKLETSFWHNSFNFICVVVKVNYQYWWGDEIVWWLANSKSLFPYITFMFNNYHYWSIAFVLDMNCHYKYYDIQHITMK